MNTIDTASGAIDISFWTDSIFSSDWLFDFNKLSIIAMAGSMIMNIAVPMMFGRTAFPMLSKKKPSSSTISLNKFQKNSVASIVGMIILMSIDQLLPSFQSLREFACSLSFSILPSQPMVTHWSNPINAIPHVPLI